MSVRAGKRREYRPVWFGPSDWANVQNYSVGDWTTNIPSGCIFCTIIGNGSFIAGPGGTGHIVLGRNCQVQGSTYGNLILGHNIVTASCNDVLCLGNNSSINGGGANLVVGSNASISGGGGANTAIGSSAVISGGGGNSVFGPSARIDGGGSNLAMGYAAHIETNGGGHTCIGAGSIIRANSGNHVLVGGGSTIEGSSSGGVLLGSGNKIYQNTSAGVCIGNRTNLFPSSSASIAIGLDTNIYQELQDAIAIGTLNTVHPQSTMSAILGRRNDIGASTFATFSMIIPDLAALANNDWVSLPNGLGGTIEIEFQVDGSFVPFGPPRYVADVQGAASSQDVANIFVGVWDGAGNTCVNIAWNDNGDGRWYVEYRWPLPGTVGNGYSVVPTVTSGQFTGSTSSGGGFSLSTECLVIGGLSRIYGGHTRDIIIGHAATIGTATDTGLQHSNIAMGNGAIIANVAGCHDSLSIKSNVTASLAAGILATGVGSEKALAMLDGAAIGTSCTGAIAIGATAVIGDGSDASIAIGMDSSANSSGQVCIAFGRKAQANDNEFIVGYADGVGDYNCAINTFAVRGLDPSNNPLDTIRAVVNPPVDHDSGLTFVYNNGGTFINRIVRVSTTTTVPGGGLALYIDP